MNSEIYELYKPVRNHLRQVSIENALFVIWAYINKFQFDQNLPKNIEVPTSTLLAKDVPTRGLYEWELTLLAREVLIHGQSQNSFATKNFNGWTYFANAINKIKKFENNVWPAVGSIELLRHEMRRIAHRQFPWQFRITSSDFVRYYKIYSNPKICDFVKQKIGISTQEWYLVGTAMMGAFLSFTKVKVDSNILISGISKKEFDIFLNFTSNDVEGIRAVIKKEVQYDDQYVYTLNPLEYYPLVKIEEHYYCPVINFLAWRITSGLYFDLVSDPRFGHPFGFAFQDYLIEVSKKIIDENKTAILPEEKYKIGKDEKDSVDIILSQSDSALFVEAKAKRLQVKSKTQLASGTAIERDLGIMADDIIQTYITMVDCTDGNYKHFKVSPNQRLFPIIVTLEDWYLFGEDAVKLEEKVIQGLLDKGISPEIIKKSPYAVCSVRTYEQLVQVLNRVSIGVIMDDWSKPDRKGHNFGQFLITNYREGCKLVDDFFPGDFDKIYPIKH